MYGSYSEWQIIGRTIILDFYYQLSVVLMIPHLWELGVLMTERMFNTSADNAEFSLMSVTQLELIILNQWTINQSLLVKRSWTISLWFSLTTFSKLIDFNLKYNGSRILAFVCLRLHLAIFGWIQSGWANISTESLDTSTSIYSILPIRRWVHLET